MKIRRIKYIFFVTLFVIISMVYQILTAFSEPKNKNILAQLVYEPLFPAYNSMMNRSINFITLYNDNSVRVFIPNNSNGIYKTLRFKKNKFDRIINLLKLSKITDHDYFESRYYLIPVDSDFYTIEVYSEERRYHLSSSLPYIEEQENVVFTDKGKHILKENETKEQYIDEKASDDYKKFRKTWDKCYNILDNLYFEITGKKIVQQF